MIIDVLLEKFPDMPNLRVREIKADKIARKVVCTVSYPNATDLPAEIQSGIKAAVASAVPFGYKCEVHIVADNFNERSFTALVLDVLKKKYPLFGNIKADKISVEIREFNVFARFSVGENTKRNIEAADLLNSLTEFFRTYTCYNVTFSVVLDENAVFNDNAIAEQEKLVHLAINRELLKPKRYFDVENVTKYIGREILTKPMYISDIRAPMDNCVVCGVISDFQLRKVKNSLRPNMLKFDLTDGSATTFPCIKFIKYELEDFETLKSTHAEKADSEIWTLSKRNAATNDNRLKKVSFLSDGLEVLVHGKIIYSEFSKRLELQIYDISKCKILPLNIQPSFAQPTPREYVLVHPQPIEEFRQLSFAQLEEKQSVMYGKNYVVLFANVTGYNVTKDKIYNICAVRLENGHLKEQFSTFVSPEQELSEAQLKIANASVRQIAVSPTITEIVSDIYKFVENAVLVGSNLQQLLEMFNYYGAPLGFNFKNQTETFSATLSMLFDNSTFDSRPNCSRVEDVAKSLKLNCRVNESAQAMATAVAKCMSALGQHTR